MITLPPGAAEIVHKMENLAREHLVPSWITSRIAAWQARIWLAQGKIEAASQWVQDCGPDVNADLTYAHEMEYRVLARILFAQGRLDDTIKLLQRLLEATERGERTSRAIEILNLQALVVQAQGDTNQAMVTLERALTLAEPGALFVSLRMRARRWLACSRSRYPWCRGPRSRGSICAPTVVRISCRRTGASCSSRHSSRPFRVG